MALRYIDWETWPDFLKILNEKYFDKIKKLQYITNKKVYLNLN